MKRGYVDTQRGQIHYATEGKGEPVLLLHRNPRSWRDFSRMIPLLAERYRVIAMDFPGFGESDPLTGPLTVMDLAQSAVDLLDGLGIEKVRAFGRHTGAAAAAELAATWPERVKALILHGFPYIATPEEREEHIKLAHQPLGSARALPVVVLEVDGAHVVRLWQRASLRFWQSKVSIPHENLMPEDLEFINDLFMDALKARLSATAAYQAVFSYDANARLPLIKAPTLLLQSMAPYSRPIAQRAETVQQLIAGSRVMSIEGADLYDLHWRAQQISDIILTFFHDPASFQKYAAVPVR